MTLFTYIVFSHRSPFNHKETGTQTLFCVLPKPHRKHEDQEDINTTQLQVSVRVRGVQGREGEFGLGLEGQKDLDKRTAEGKRDSRQQEALQVCGGEKAGLHGGG